jgi:GNAT superfamily N-acetyltransferase
MGEILIRWASVADADVICDVIHQSFAEYEGRLIPPSAAMQESPASIASELADCASAWIAVVDGDAVGCVLARPKDDDFYFGRLSTIASLRGRGIAARLIEAVEAFARSQGYAAVTCSARISLEANRRLFAGLGYVEVGRSTHPGFSNPTSVDLRKSLL